jgi:uncharacterized membrane protein
MPPPPPPPPPGGSPYSAPGAFSAADDFGTPGSNDEKMKAAIAQGAGLIGMGAAIALSSFIPGAGLVGNVIAIGLPIWMITQYKGKSQFVVSHSLQALHWAALGLAIVVASLMLTIITLGLGAFCLVLPLCLFGLVSIVLSIIATYKAYSGEPYRFPITGNWTFLNSYFL